MATDRGGHAQAISSIDRGVTAAAFAQDEAVLLAEVAALFEAAMGGRAKEGMSDHQAGSDRR